MNMFKSVNIVGDLDRDSVIRAYRPTRKTLQVIRAVCGLEGSRTTHVVAPYGAGKSIAALAGLKCLTGTSEITGPLIARIGSVDPQLADDLRQVEGLTMFCLLHGYTADIGSALCQSIKIDPQDNLAEALKALLARARKIGAQRLLIVWDEFGLHLETMVREGRTKDLLDLQDLAEWTVRRNNPTVTLTTLMHQGVNSFSRRVSDTAQEAWRKIEGRFDTLSLIDDGIDAFEMLADALQGKGDSDLAAVHKAKTEGFFQRIGDPEKLAGLLSRSVPLTPPAVDLLPRLSAQVAQNERTMMHFVEELRNDASAAVGLPALYDYFAPAMRADRGPGGTHRRFIEAETALSRAQSPLQKDVVKAAALLQLGSATERVRLPMSRLLFAVTEGLPYSTAEANQAISDLLDLKVLLFRRRLDDVSIWHGTDQDLTNLIAEEATRVTIDLNVVDTLERLFPADAYVAPQYNYERSITRFAPARYVLTGDLLDSQRREKLVRAGEVEDALVALVIDGHPEDADLTSQADLMPPHVITALPKRSVDAIPVLAELVAIENLLDRKELLDSDPLVERELLELRSEAETTLKHGLDLLMNPDRGAVTWHSGGNVHDFRDGSDHGEVLAQIFESRFPRTPRIRNEQVVRRTVSAVSRSARKRCILAVIERSGFPELGYESATSADASIYRTVFARTGLYRQAGKAWGWAEPGELQDAGLRDTWSILSDFFNLAENEPKSFTELFDRLTAPPLGLREGLLPLLLAAGLQAFGRCTALRETSEGRTFYVDDINPSIIQRICAGADRFSLEVPKIASSQIRMLAAFVREVAGELDPQEPDLVRAFYDGLLAWKAGLPPSALTTSGIGPHADLVQPLLRRRGFDPIAFLFHFLPAATRTAPLSPECLDAFRAAMGEMEGIAKSFSQRAETVAARLFNARSRDSDLPLLDAAARWANTLPLEAEHLRALDQEARGIVSRAKGAQAAPRGSLGFVTTLSGILSGTGFDEWNEGSVLHFQTKLDDVLTKVEDLALQYADGSQVFEPLMKQRISSIFDQYAEKLGTETLLAYLADIYKGTK